MYHFTSSFLKCKSNLMVITVSLLNVAFNMAFLDLNSCAE